MNLVPSLDSSWTAKSWTAHGNRTPAEVKLLLWDPESEQTTVPCDSSGKRDFILFPCVTDKLCMELLFSASKMSAEVSWASRMPQQLPMLLQRKETFVAFLHISKVAPQWSYSFLHQIKILCVRVKSPSWRLWISGANSTSPTSLPLACLLSILSLHLLSTPPNQREPVLARH